MTPLAAAANENLAQISNYLVYSSMAVYMLAFFAHIAEWTFGSRSKVARTAAALTAAAPAPAVQVRSKGAVRPSSTNRRSSHAPPRARATCPTARAPRAAPSRVTCTGGSRSR